MSEGADKREQINFISVDSAPKRFAGPVPEWQAPKMLALFTALATTQLWLENRDAPAIIAVLASLLNGVPRGTLAVPECLIFRVLRAYFTLESMLSILIDVRAEDLERVIRLDLVRD